MRCEDVSCERAFPASNSVKNMKSKMNWAGLKMATNCSYQYPILPVDDSSVSGLTLCYRAIVEPILQKHFSYIKYRVKKIHAKHYASFSQYVDQACEKFCAKKNGKWEKL